MFVPLQNVTREGRPLLYDDTCCPDAVCKMTERAARERRFMHFGRFRSAPGTMLIRDVIRILTYTAMATGKGTIGGWIGVFWMMAAPADVISIV